MSVPSSARRSGRAEPRARGRAPRAHPRPAGGRAPPRGDLAKEARKQARKGARETSTRANPPDHRERAQRFVREQLGRGPKPVTTVEEAAAKAHVDPHALEQARADLGVVTSCGNAGGVMAVQRSLPG